MPAVIAVGTDAGGPAVVRLYDAATLTALREFSPYPGYVGGIRVAQGDVTGDGVPDLITATAGKLGHVKVFDGVSGAEVRSLLPFGRYPAGLYVTAGDLDGDGYEEVVVGLESGPTHVKAFSGATGAESMSFIAYEGFQGGVRVAAGDLDGDGDADLATVAGPGGNGHIKAFDGHSLALIQSYLAYVNFDGDIQLAIAHLSAGGTIVTTALNVTAGTHVRGTLADGRTVLSYLAPLEFSDPKSMGRVSAAIRSARVAAVDLNKDGIDELLFANGPGDPTRLLVQDGRSLAELDLVFAFDPKYNRGAFIG